MKTNIKSLLTLMFKKEKLYFKKLRLLFREMDDFGSKYISYPIIVILVTFFHYCFATMHFLFELYLSFSNRTQFEQNMKMSHVRVDKKMSNLKG